MKEENKNVELNELGKEELSMVKGGDGDNGTSMNMQFMALQNSVQSENKPK